MSDYLTVTDHNRDIQGFTYVYPVVSRRAGGVSVGINLNINNACNWRCVYCQVPNLSRGFPPPVDMAKLRDELRSMLAEIVHGDFMTTYVPEQYRVLADIAFSGNGEPTSAKQFPEILYIIEEILKEFSLLGQVKIRIITNGSQSHKPAVMDALRHLGRLNGEVWFKLDAGTQDDILRINDVHINPDQHVRHLAACAQLCDTWVQTCMFIYKKNPPSESMLSAYLKQLEKVSHWIKGVHLYSVARPSYQPEAKDIEQLSYEALDTIAFRIRQLGLTVTVNP